MRQLTLAAAVFGVVLLLSGAVGAVTNGTLDGNGHPYVGLMVAQDANGTPLWRCSGTLMSRRIFLTAGHCVEGPMFATPKLVQINTGFTGDHSLLLSNNTVTGGTCFGDSGGPNFIGTSNVVGGVTSFGQNDTCAGTGGVYRVDRSDNLNWLATFGLTPP